MSKKLKLKNCIEIASIGQKGAFASKLTAFGKLGRMLKENKDYIIKLRYSTFQERDVERGHCMIEFTADEVKE